jgi:hypothetical protein
MIAKHRLKQNEASSRAAASTSVLHNLPVSTVSPMAAFLGAPAEPAVVGNGGSMPNAAAVRALLRATDLPAHVQSVILARIEQEAREMPSSSSSCS